VTKDCSASTKSPPCTDAQILVKQPDARGVPPLSYGYQKNPRPYEVISGNCYRIGALSGLGTENSCEWEG
jgi:hypothetical protein